MARRPFSLTAYLALARGRERLTADPSSWHSRPDMSLLWLHSDTQGRLKTLMTLIKRLRLQRDAFRVLCTCDAATSVTFGTDGAAVSVPPAETASDVNRFIEHWHPDILVWAGNGLRPALIHEASEHGTRMMLADATDAPWRQPCTSWLPDVSRSAIALFDRILAQNDAAELRLRKMGIPAQQIEVTSALEDEIVPLDSNDDLHEEMTATLGGRPVWLAARIHREEADIVLRAHRRAARLAHRLLLVIVPAKAEDETAIAATAHEVGLRLAQWDNGEMPDENTQVLLASDDSELGLWYRLAPLSFLGGSMAGYSGGQSPMMAAALGSAILYGPHVGQHLDAYSRLVSAGGARIVKDMDSLSTAVSHLIAPDRAAAMAHAGWNVVSAGAETADLILSQIEDWLDGIEAHT